MGVIIELIVIPLENSKTFKIFYSLQNIAL